MKILKFTINKKIQLSKSFSQNEQKEFSKYLIRIGEGLEKTIDSIGENIIKLPNYICVPMTNPLDLIKIIYADLENNFKDASYIMDRAILATTNKTCDIINENFLTLLPTEEHNYYSADSTLNESDNIAYPTEFLNTLTFTGMPPHNLHLKLNSVVICIRNLNTAKGLCNGTRLIVKKFKDHVIECLIITGTHKGENIFIPRITLSPSEEDIPFDFKRRQFPIKLAFSLTVKRSQGQTIKKVGFYVDAPLFHHGQYIQ